MISNDMVRGNTPTTHSPKTSRQQEELLEYHVLRLLVATSLYLLH
jgi:hypothetical protein